MISVCYLRNILYRYIHLLFTRNVKVLYVKIYTIRALVASEKEIHTFFVVWFVGSRDSSFSRCTMHAWWHILQDPQLNSVLFAWMARDNARRPVSHATTPRRCYLFNLRVLLRAISLVAARFISAAMHF